MGLIYANITLANPSRQELLPIEQRALVDTGAMFLCIPNHVANQLELKESERREVTLADGSKKFCPYVGPVQVRYKNRMCFVGALVLEGESTLLGAIPIEDMDLVTHPAQLRLDVNPDNPNFAGAIVM